MERDKYYSGPVSYTCSKPSRKQKLNRLYVNDMFEYQRTKRCFQRYHIHFQQFIDEKVWQLNQKPYSWTSFQFSSNTFLRGVTANFLLSYPFSLHSRFTTTNPKTGHVKITKHLYSTTDVLQTVSRDENISTTQWLW